MGKRGKAESTTQPSLTSFLRSKDPPAAPPPPAPSEEEPATAAVDDGGVAAEEAPAPPSPTANEEAGAEAKGQEKASLSVDVDVPAAPERRRTPVRAEWKRLAGEMMRELEQRDEEGWFAAAVDPERDGVPDYLDIIKEPMDFATIKERLDAGSYDGPAPWARDVRLVFENAKKYNEMPDHCVHRAAQRLLDHFEYRFPKVFPPPRPPSPAKPASDGSKRSTAASPKGRKRRHSGGKKEEGQDGEGSDVEVVEVVREASNGRAAPASSRASSSSSAGRGGSSGGSNGGAKELAPIFQKGGKKKPAAPAASESKKAGGAGKGSSKAAASKPSTAAAGLSSPITVVEVVKPPSAPPPPLTDEELLVANDFFLKAADKKRKAQLLAERAKAERQRRRELEAQSAEPVEVHPFFHERARPTHTAGKEDGSDASASSWVLPAFPPVQHVLQQQDDDEPAISTACQQDGLSVSWGSGVVESLRGGLGLQSAMEAEDGTAAEAAVIDVDAEEEEAGQLRAVLRCPTTSTADVAPAEQEEEDVAPEVGVETRTAEEVSLAVSGGDEHTARAYLKEAARCCKATPSADLLPLEGEVVDEAGQWVDKYRPKRPSLVCCAEGSGPSQFVMEWLKAWKARRKQHHSHDHRDGGDESDGSYEGGWYFGSDDSDDDENPFPRALLLVGPTGCGKSSLVHACARKMDISVLEVNTGQIRSGAEIKKNYSEAAQSMHIGGQQQPNSAEGFFGSKKSGGRAKGGKGKKKAQAGPRRLSLMLFEEVDLVFEEDSGFSKAVRDLVQGAKWPIVLTANSLPTWLHGPRYKVVEMTRPPTTHLATLLSAVWAAEGLPPLPPSSFLSLARAKACDVRASLMALQLWACRPEVRKAAEERSRLEGEREMVVIDDEDEDEEDDEEVVVVPSQPQLEEAGFGERQEEGEGEPQAQDGEELGDGDEVEADLTPSGLQPKAVAHHATSSAAHPLGYHYPRIHQVFDFKNHIDGGKHLTIQGEHFLQPAADGQGGYGLVEVMVGRQACEEVYVECDSCIKIVAPPAYHKQAGPAVVTVRVARLFSNDADRLNEYQGNILYYDPSGVVAHFPPVYVPKGGRQQDTTTPPSSSKKRRKGGARQAAAAAADEEEEGEEELVLPGDEVAGKRRRLIRCKEDDDEEEAELDLGDDAVATPAKSEAAADSPQKAEESLEGTPAAGVVPSSPFTPSASVDGASAEEEEGGSSAMEVRADEAVIADGDASPMDQQGPATAEAMQAAAASEGPAEAMQEEAVEDLGAGGPEQVEDLGRVVEGPVPLPKEEKVFRVAYRCPWDDDGSAARAGLASLREAAEAAEALSAAQEVQAVAGRVDGDTDVLLPCRSMLPRRPDMDLEATPWPISPGCSATEIGGWLTSLATHRHPLPSALGSHDLGLLSSETAAATRALLARKTYSRFLPSHSLSACSVPPRVLFGDLLPTITTIAHTEVLKSQAFATGRRGRSQYRAYLEHTHGVGSDEIKVLAAQSLHASPSFR